MAGLYIHIPFCRSKCAYCDFPSFSGRESAAGRYFSAMVREAELFVPSPNPMGACRSVASHQVQFGREGVGGEGYPGRVQRPAPTQAFKSTGDGVGFATVFIGGGTPSLLPAGGLERLMEDLRRIFTIEPVEFTVEANPGTVDREKLESFRRMGADRLSFGVQAAQDGLLKRIGRIHTWADFIRSVELARAAGFKNINADMMTGLPGQTEADAVATAEKLAALGLEHVSCYGLIVEDGTPLARSIQKGDEIPPDDDSERAMFHAARAVLEQAGFIRYEISNFAKPGRECLHNLNYWHNGSWLGLGLGAASAFPGFRRENKTDLEQYMAALESGVLPPAEEHVISAEDAVFESIMLELRLAEGIDVQRFRARHGFDFLSRYAAQVEKFISSGLMRRTPAGVALTTLGMDLQNTVLMEFM